MICLMNERPSASAAGLFAPSEEERGCAISDILEAPLSVHCSLYIHRSPELPGRLRGSAQRTVSGLRRIYNHYGL